MTLTDFLLARIAEDKQRAKDIVSITYTPRWETNGEFVISTTRLDNWQERLTAEADAKRRIVALHTPLDGEECDPSCGEIMSPCPTLAALALPYADHTDYRETWRP